MADRIKGITVVLGGDTTGLSKALSGVNKEINSTQAQLKDVEKLLKLDPGNTQLLEQKQRLLAKALENTSSKVKELKNAADSLTVDDKKYEEWKKALSNIQGQTTKTETEIAKLQKEISQFKVGTEEYDALAKKLDQCKQKYADLQKKANDTFEELGRPIGQNEYDSLIRELAAATQEEKRLKEAAEKSSVAMAKIGEAAKTVADGTEKLADGVDKLNEKAKITSAAVIGGATFALKSVSDLDSAVGQFISRTGEAADSSEKWQEALEEIYNGNYGDGYEDVANSAATVKQVLEDITPGGLVDVTKNAIALRDTFDYDVAESVRAAKALIDNFGVSADDAFNLIATGAQNGLDYSGELLDTISEYSVQFGKVGLSAEDFFNILQTGADNGAFNLDKIGDAVKEMAIRVVDGSDTTIQGFELAGLSADEMSQKFAAGGETARNAFFETLQAISSIEDPVQQNIAGVDLLGTMWEDLGANVVLAMGQATESTYAADDALEKIKEQKYNNLISDLQTIGKTAISDIVVPLGEQLMPIIEEVIGKIKELVSAFSNMSDGQRQIVIAVGAIVAALPALLTFVSGFLGVVGTISQGIALFTGAITTAPAAATGFAAVLKIVASALGGIGTVIGSATKVIGAFLLLLKSGFVSAIKAAIGGLSAFGKALSTAFTGAIGLIKSAVIGLYTVVTQTIVPAITAALQGLFAFIAANPVILVIAAIVAAVVGLAVLINTYSEQIRAALQSVDDFLQNVFATDWTTVFGPGLGDVLNGFMANLKNIWDAIYDIFNGVITFITGVFSGNWKQAWEGIKQVFKGIFDGLVAIVKAPLNGIISLINAVIGAINSMIDGLNSVSISVPEGVPVLGGKTLGFDIGHLPTVPYLAKGGTVVSGSAVVGEAGPELLTVGPGGTVVTPLSGGSTTNNTTNLGGITLQVFGAPGQNVNELADVVMDRIETLVQQRSAVFGNG